MVLPAIAAAAPALGDPCPNGDVRQAQGVGGLPDCIALEQVSPQMKHNQPARILFRNIVDGTLSFGNISPEGNRVLFRSTGALGGTPGLQDVFGDVYVATRDATGQGWATDHTSPPAGIVRGWIEVPVPHAISADLSRWFQIASSRKQWEMGLGQAFHGGLDGTFQPISPLLTPLSGTPEGSSGQVIFHSRGSSADGSRLYFVPDISITYLPDDPTPTGAGAEKSTYVAGLDSIGNPSLQLLARDRDEKVWGGNCGAGVGGNQNVARNVGSISADGSRVYFTTRPHQPATGACDSVNNKRRIMVREETPTGPVIEELFPSPSGVGDDTFQGASVEGDRIYFTTTRSLVASDGDGALDLYLYDAAQPVDERLTNLSGSGPAVPNVATISGDGSHAYFNSGDVLTSEPGPGITGTAQPGVNNLYLYERSPSHPDGRIAFIGIASAGSAYPVPVLGPDRNAFGVGGDGHRLFFTSNASLTADDTDGGFGDVFRYDAEDDTLVRISKAAPGGADNGGVVGAFGGSALGSDASDNHHNSPDYVGRGRWVSEDGETVAFKTADGLVPGDGNGIMDSYVWRGGRLFRLPGTADSTNGLTGSGLLDRPLVSLDGETVAFQTFEQLLLRDRDTAIDVYVARVGGGFPEPPPEEICIADGAGRCQGPAANPPGDSPAASAVFSGRGNLAERRRSKRKPCRKGARRVRRNGKARCVRKRVRRKAERHATRGHRIRNANDDRRAGK